MKRFILTIAWLSTALAAGAQLSVGEVLRSVEANNKELQANRRLVDAQKWEARAENNLPDPTVTYSHLYGNKEGMGFTGELIASQSFDFPSLYHRRGRLARQRGESYERQGEEVRQQILLQAKEACLDLIFLNRQKQLLELRRENAEQLTALYRQRLEQGDASVLETNKIELELLNVRNEARMNEAARANKLRELELLNGGVPVQLSDTAYEAVALPSSFADLRREVLEGDRRLLSLQSEKEVSSKLVGVSRAMGLPSFELGYRMNPSSGGERYNGFLVGISLPLFSNRHRVKQAKAQSLYADLQLESMTATVESELLRLYNQSVALKTSIDEYDEVLEGLNSLELLNKAIRAGHISMIDYFVDATTLYQSMQNHLLLQNEYQKVMARIYKFRL